MQVTELGGHSGCRILLCEEDNGSVFVRKISGATSYNDRLCIQAEKQNNYNSEFVNVPKVYKTGFTDNGLFYFDMQYIQGITLAEYVKKIEISNVRPLVEKLLFGVLDIKNGDVGGDISDIFVKKIKSVEKTIPLNNTVTAEALSVLYTHNWSLFSEGKCHGDLTLENILIRNGDIYLIDFLDSFYDCGLLDVATLLQDTLLLWSYRKQSIINDNTVMRLIVFRDILTDAIKEKMGNSYVEVYYALLLKWLRIYPYTKDEETVEFLNTKTLMLLNLIKETEK